MFSKSKISAAVTGAIYTVVAAQAVAQQGPEEVEQIEVRGVRGSLSQSMNVKRQSSGVVDAISAEDMGKFPDTNLAESLQRITGVSINRVNGEGSEVTVRGFGGNFNLITLNGRQMPAANVSSITGNPLDQGSTGTTRSFDFSNLASEGVSGIEVYKTGRAAIPSGGIGATININTLKPLTQGENRASVGVKAMKDESGDGVTPEVSGVTNWSNDDQTFGVSVFGSYQERDSGSRTMSVERYDLETWGPDALETLGMQNANITNAPADGTLVAIPSNLGLGTNSDNRERINGMVTLQYAPSDTLTLTADASYARNEMESNSLVDGIWFARQFTDVEFDGNPLVATPIRLTEDIDGGKDFFFQNLVLGTKDELKSFGVNADWWVNDNLNLRFDAATSKATSGGNAPYGKNSIRFNVAGATAGWQTADFSRSIPQASIVVDDTLKGNNNGIFDLPDVGSQVSQTAQSSQESSVDQFQFSGKWDKGGDLFVDFGVGYLTTEMQQNRLSTQAILGGWGVDNPGDVPEGLLDITCTGCAFEDHDMNGVEGADAIAQPPGSPTIPLGSVSFRGNAVELLEVMAPMYGFTAGNLPATGSDNNTIKEDIFSAYAQVTMDGEVGGMPVNLVVGARYEKTDVTSTASQRVPTDIVWLSDNDYNLILGDEVVQLSADHSYENLLPNIDLSVNITDDLKARASYSMTLARPSYDQLYAATSVNVPNRPTLLGGAPSGNVGNAKLDPLESNNFDLSLEWYYGESSMISVGYYRKDVANFVGTQQVAEPLFGLLDPNSGQPGTLSGDAVEALNAQGVTVTERNFFTMAAILANPSAFPGGAAEFDESQGFADAVFGTYDILAREGDPEFLFELTRPINNQSARISGYELAWQHFFGESGFGYQANFTIVDGDIGYDIASDPTVDQFALEGLSDSANLVLIYEKDGLSARIAYNWRDAFLDEVNRSVSSVRNPLFVDEYEQIDINVSYDFNEDLTVSLDVINLTEEGQRQYGRTYNNTFFVQELDRRFVLSARYNF
ncbi:TonB-dependent receptor [Salinimonas lutimaris]|uniref:TonB-dependent receptor n=1 Tax=Salinimonas lutimaris TaxID=914153 RepID=UPI0010C0449C|nr:TonB-dependent receptor [Salinimonas lutimaris]